MSNYRCFVFDSFETGCGSVIGIFITTSNHSEEDIWDMIETCFDYYYIGLVKEVNPEELREYENYLPRYVIGLLSGEVSTPGAFRWHSQFMINYA